MKALTIWQPWATAVALGIKTIETRGWLTGYRGPLAIHAATAKSGDKHRFAQMLKEPGDREKFEAAGYLKFDDLPFDRIVAVVNLARVDNAKTITPGAVNKRWGIFHTPGKARFAWFLEDIRKIDNAPPVRGNVGLWNLHDGYPLGFDVESGLKWDNGSREPRNERTQDGK